MPTPRCLGRGPAPANLNFSPGIPWHSCPQGSIPYQQYILDDAPSMASLLKEAGYRTLAFHPGERTSWQRDRAYPRLGFDQFKCRGGHGCAPEHGARLCQRPLRF